MLSHNPFNELREIIELERQNHKLLRKLLNLHTPKHIRFMEITMLPPNPGNTLVFTGTVSPDGSSFAAGTSFTAVSADPNVAASVDSTGLVVTAVIGAAAVAGTVADITWATSTFSPEPTDSPASLSVVIPLTIGAVQPPPVPTPTSVTFTQTA